MGLLSLDPDHFHFLIILKETLTFLSLSNPVPHKDSDLLDSKATLNLEIDWCIGCIGVVLEYWMYWSCIQIKHNYITRKALLSLKTKVCGVHGGLKMRLTFVRKELIWVSSKLVA